MSGKEELDIFGVTFHNLSVPLWCNDVSLKLIHFKILPCVTLTGHHTTAGACFGSSFGQNLMREAEMEKAIKIAQIQKRPTNISTNEFATKQRKRPIKL